MEIKIKEIRQKNKIKQKELASLLSISPQALSGYESGYRQPDLKTLVKIAKILKTTTDSLLGVEACENNTQDYIMGDEKNLIKNFRKLSVENQKQVEKIVDGLKLLENNINKK